MEFQVFKLILPPPFGGAGGLNFREAEGQIGVTFQWQAGKV